MGPLILALAQAVTPLPATAPPPVAKPKTICVVEDKIGSRLGGKRICYTKEEYAEYLAKMQTELRSRQRTGYFAGSRGACTRGVDC